MPDRYPIPALIPKSTAGVKSMSQMLKRSGRLILTFPYNEKQYIPDAYTIPTAVGPRSIAIVNPLGDFAMNAYSFELAEGLCSNGINVDVYTSAASPLSDFPDLRRHRCFPVLGGLLTRQRFNWEGPLITKTAEAAQHNLSTPSGTLKPGHDRENSLRRRARGKLLELELAAHLKRHHYDLIWTQWPNIYGHGFWATCKLFGLRIVHTVHNVLPHEENPNDITDLQRVYRNCDRLIVHSEHSKAELLRLFPDVASKELVMPHGLYTIYRPSPEARDRLRQELRIANDEVACLICGLIRPYKNVDSSLHAISRLAKTNKLVLIVAGQEAGFADCSSADPLAHTRRIVRDCGIEAQVRFVPRFLSQQELAEFFEAADILLLPYVKGYGSGLLLLGMTFNKHIVATNAGGACEYLRHYSRYTLLRSPDAADIANGIAEAMKGFSSERRPQRVAPIRDLQWNNIARNVLCTIRSAY